MTLPLKDWLAGGAFVAIVAIVVILQRESVHDSAAAAQAKIVAKQHDSLTKAAQEET